jgi:hypothetical protein
VGISPRRMAVGLAWRTDLHTVTAIFGHGPLQPLISLAARPRRCALTRQDSTAGPGQRRTQVLRPRTHRLPLSLAKANRSFNRAPNVVASPARELPRRQYPNPITAHRSIREPRSPLKHPLGERPRRQLATINDAKLLLTNIHKGANLPHQQRTSNNGTVNGYRRGQPRYEQNR